MKHVWNYAVYFGAATCLVCMLYVFAPTQNFGLLGEDRGIESMTVAFYLLASCVAFAARIHCTKHRSFLLFVAVAGVLGALEELSYGERIFKFTAPVIGGRPIDSAHDVVYILFGPQTIASVKGAAFALLVLGISCILFTLAYAFYKRSRLAEVVKQPPVILLIIIVLLGVISLSIDLNTEYGLPFLLEELFEMHASVALLFCAISLWRPASLGPSGRRPIYAATFIALSAAVCLHYVYLSPVEKLRISAEHRNLYAMYLYAMRCYQGDGVAADKEASLKWALRGAAANDQRAQLLASVHYYRGEGTQRDLKQSAHWCRRSAEEGHMFAAYCLGRMYYGGVGVEKDFDEAFRWTREAAEGGVARAALLLGGMYEKGHGVAQDRVKAKMWRQWAANNEPADEDALALGL